MARNDDLNRLRAEVRQAHRRATAKASRLRNKGVEISGSDFDPRRNLANVKKYNATQLRAYQRQLNEFTNRRTSFEAGLNGAPLPADLVKRYKRTEEKYNNIAKREYSKVADIPLPGRNMTVRQADFMDRPTGRVRAGGEIVSRPLDPMERNLSNVTSAESLEKLERQLRSKTTGTYKKRRLREQREELIEMLVEIGDSDLTEKAMNLSDDQFNILWNYNASVVEEIARDYEFTKLRAAKKTEEFQERMHEGASGRIAKALDWASSLPRNTNPSASS